MMLGAMTVARLTELLLKPHLLLLLPTIFIGVPALFLRTTRSHAQRVMAASYRALKIYAAPEPGLIPFSYQHYSGYFVYALETTLQGYATSEDATRLGKRVLLHNWTSGLCSFGGLLGAIASTSQYFNVKQAAKAAHQHQQTPSAIRQTPVEIPSADAPSIGMQRFGLILRYTGLLLLVLLLISATLQYTMLKPDEINGFLMILSAISAIGLIGISGLWS